MALDNAAALFETVREYQAETERERCIPKPLVAQLDEAGLHRMLLPTSLGGLQLDIPTLFRVVELVAEADGSVGWNLMNNSIIQLSSLALPEAGLEEIFGPGPDQIIAGTLVPGGGRGRRVEGGYEVSGRWRFGSGCREAQWMIANFDLEADPAPESGVYRMAVRIEEVTIIDTWDMTGMRGTASHDWSVTNVFVPDRRVLFVPGRVLLNQWQRWPGTLYQLPVHTIIGPHHSMIATGHRSRRHRRPGGTSWRQGAPRPRRRAAARSTPHPGHGRARGGAPGRWSRVPRCGRARGVGDGGDRQDAGPGRVRPLPSGWELRGRLRARRHGPGVPCRWHHVDAAHPTAGTLLARPAGGRPGGGRQSGLVSSGGPPPARPGDGAEADGQVVGCCC